MEVFFVGYALRKFFLTIWHFVTPNMAAVTFWKEACFFILSKAGVSFYYFNENAAINYSCHFKPIRPSFIFWTQIKIFLMKSESFLTLHRQQHNWNIQDLKGSKDSIKIVHVTSQWFNPNFMKLREYFLCAKKTKITNLFNNFFSSVSVFGRRSQEYHDKCMLYCYVLTKNPDAVPCLQAKEDAHCV